MLTDAQIRALVPKDRSYRVFDGGGLYIEVPPRGAKRWRYKYRFRGKEKLLALGTYPTVKGKEAREKHAEARKLLANGIDPAAAKKTRKNDANSFKAIAREWLDKFAPSRAGSYTRTLNGRLRLHLLPALGDRHIADITPLDLLETTRRIEAKGRLDTAHRALQLAGQVFNYAIQTGRAQHNPALPLKGALPPAIRKRMSAITDPRAIGRLLLDIDRYSGAFTTRCALKLSPLIFLRPGELRALRWDQVDFERAELRLPIEHMKGRQTEKIARQGEIVHIVPLARQAVELLTELRRTNGDTPFLFPHCRERQSGTMSGKTVLSALRAMGYGSESMSAHGFRRMASTNLNEQGYNRDYIEKQLAHQESNAVRAAYNDAAWLEQRRAMMQAWADWLDERREEARAREQTGAGSPRRSLRR